jgi:hypothetical protein
VELWTIWLLSAAAGAFIASHRNRSPFNWFFAGLLLGPLALSVMFFPRWENPYAAQYGTPPDNYYSDHYDDQRAENSAYQDGYDNPDEYEPYEENPEMFDDHWDDPGDF